MNEKFKWIVVYGGLGWGIPFALCMLVLRWIEYKPMLFGSSMILLFVSIVGGLLWGVVMYQPNIQKETCKFFNPKYWKSLFYLFIILVIYAGVYRFLLVPHHTGLGSLIFILLIIFGVIFQKKIIINNK